ncbi:GGDEF domain-containing protein [Oceanobacillus polygoni]|uniref:Diguanylate cyclase (GGDEF)-like protein n=1 Tax=Oceanobacillus polygoni TaxID=1235259 RepID=A0A9X1CA96_9BACI|nr:GGDEF domain-containing protein [Oceanobacillus polygoni]MBP2076359.1 diguanylate cyclase (GGDEF)-like protein [Oceanobacillus polygoni]
MNKLKVYIASIFIISLTVAIVSGPIDLDLSLYIQFFLVYLLFTTLYSHLKTIVRTGNVNVDYSISYGFSFILITGPLGLFLFEIINRFYIYFYRKRTGTADEDEFLHTFYNIGGPALLHTIGYFIFYALYPYVEGIPFGFWGLLIAIIAFTDFISSLLLLSVFKLTGNIGSRQDAINFIKGRSIFDTLKMALSNGLLFIFLVEQHWEAVIALFVLNYLVSRSAAIKNQSIQHKMERDRFEQMAYTDFLTKTHNRSYMNKIMNELNHTEENVALIVSDIDTFKIINDTFNHTVGDTVIQHFANTIKSHLDEGDFLFRSGGEEFTIVLRNRDFSACVELLKQIHRDVAANPAQAEYKSEDTTIYYTASFGMYYFKTNQKLSMKQAYIHADDLLLQSKRLGRNQVAVMQDEAVSVQDVDKAVERL